MEFSDNTIHHIELINSVLDDIGVPRLFENSDFVADMDSAGYYSLVIDVAPGNRRTGPFTLFLGDGIRLDVCGINESFEWTNEQIFTSRASITDFFKKLFTSYILMESCGSANAKSRMYLFDKEGNFVEKYALRGFVQKFSGWECEKVLFTPIY